MPSDPKRPTELSWTERLALAGEIIGSTARLPATAGRPRPITGTIVDESLATITIREPGRTRELRVPKTGLVGTIIGPAGELPLSGELLRTRPEDRTKRLLAGGRRRFR